jgi:hypothetical protein
MSVLKATNVVPTLTVLIYQVPLLVNATSVTFRIKTLMCVKTMMNVPLTLFAQLTVNAATLSEVTSVFATTGTPWLMAFVLILTSVLKVLIADSDLASTTKLLTLAFARLATKTKAIQSPENALTPTSVTTKTFASLAKLATTPWVLLCAATPTKTSTL